MREFGASSLRAQLLAAGFCDATFLTDNVPECGVLFDHDTSQPLIARNHEFTLTTGPAIRWWMPGSRRKPGRAGKRARRRAGRPHSPGLRLAMGASRKNARNRPEVRLARHANPGNPSRIVPALPYGKDLSWPLWRTYLAMNERCPVCDLKYEREQGYFLGAMYFSYMLSIPPVLVLVLFLWWLTSWRFDLVLVAAFVAYLPMVPAVTRFARVLWLYLDRHFDPDQ